MNGLAIDTTSEACSVAVVNSHGQVFQRHAHAPRQHGELLLGWIESLLQEADMRPAQLDAIWVTQGPGSFTSLRMGFSVATSLAFALDRPVVPVSSLLALAARAVDADAQNPVDGAEGSIEPGLVLATLDARLGEVYAAWYRLQTSDGQTLLTLQGAEQLLRPRDLQWPDAASARSATALGNGLLVAAENLLLRAREEGFCCRAGCWPQARDLFNLADAAAGIAAWQVQLPYLRKKVADKPVMDT